MIAGIVEIWTAVSPLRSGLRQRSTQSIVTTLRPKNLISRKSLSAGLDRHCSFSTIEALPSKRTTRSPTHPVRKRAFSLSLLNDRIESLRFPDFNGKGHSLVASPAGQRFMFAMQLAGLANCKSPTEYNRRFPIERLFRRAGSQCGGRSFSPPPMSCRSRYCSPKTRPVHLRRRRLNE